jgi:uncharacterized delta-60 repeat protein
MGVGFAGDSPSGIKVRMALNRSPDMGRVGVAAAVLTGMLALSAPAASSRAQVAGDKELAERGSRSLDYAYALAIQRNGRLVVAGLSAYAGGRFALARYTLRGKLDPSFGSGGKVLTAFGSRGYSLASALAIERDGKLVAAGQSRVTVLSDDFAIGRYGALGRLDSSFGRGGKVLTDFGSRKRISGWARALAIQADGKIVAAGLSGVLRVCCLRFALSRYTARGKLDPTFGRGGKVVTQLGSEGSAEAVAIQRDGKIVVAGNGGVGDRYDFALARYTSRGKLDPSFGRGGTVLTDFGSFAAATAVVIDADGKIVAVGQSGDDFALARYTADGKLDPSFGSDGKVVTNFGFTTENCPPCLLSTEGASALAIQADGKLVVAGSSDARGEWGEKHCCIQDFALARYNADGSLDPSFGSSGKVLTIFFPANSYAEAVGIKADGKIVAAGGGAGYFALARYTTSGKLDATFGSGGKVVTNFRTR